MLVRPIDGKWVRADPEVLPREWVGESVFYLTPPRARHVFRYCAGDRMCPTPLWVPVELSHRTAYCEDHAPEGSERFELEI